MLAKLLALLLCVGPTSAALAQATRPATTRAAAPRNMDDIWADLSKADPQAADALLELAARPAESIAYLRPRLLPLRISSEDALNTCTNLSSGDDAVWKAAFEKLGYLDPRLAVDLSMLMDSMQDPVGRCRLVEVLCDYPAGTFSGKTITLRATGDGQFNFVDDKGSSWWAESNIARLSARGWGGGKKYWTRAMRAIVLLKHIGTPDARDILEKMSTGTSEAPPTQCALEALDELSAVAKKQ